MKERLYAMLNAIGVVLFAVALLGFSPLTTRGISQGLSLCGRVLIPSLFPFMALAVFVGRSRAGAVFCRLLGPLCRRWLRLPPQLAPAVLMSFIGGYPVGARMLAGMLDRGEATPEQAQRILSFAITPAPSFAIVTLGAGLMGSTKAGTILYGCHLFTALLLGGWYARRSKTPQTMETKSSSPLPFSAALVESTSAAVEGMLSICGFVLLFSVLLSFLQGCGATQLFGQVVAFLSCGKISAEAAAAALCGLLEITCGAFACQTLSWQGICVLLPFLASFGSLSVLCQVSACLNGREVSTAALLRGRLIHGFLSALMAAPLLWQLQPSVEALARPAQPLGGSAPVLSTLALLGMCSLFLLSLEGTAPAKKFPSKSANF
ncbi:MAG: hypothetical protein IJ508_06555 [Oscillospiraceae bacterium]|nr:hypothetical protein [Oscillospiraceae bacterium]